MAQPMRLQRLDAGHHATNNLTAGLVIAGSLDQEVLVPDVTLSVIKPNRLQGWYDDRRAKYWLFAIRGIFDYFFFYSGRYPLLQKAKKCRLNQSG